MIFVFARSNTTKQSHLVICLCEEQRDEAISANPPLPLYAQVDSPRSNVLYFLGENKQVACFQIIKTIRLKAGLSCKNRNNNEK